VNITLPPAMNSMLTPVLALICWSLVMLIWTYATRIPAIGKARVNPATAQEPSALNALPLKVRQVGYNYNHLMEQPTIFYALAFYIQLACRPDTLFIEMAWAYVALRVLHSLVQATVNVIMLRFSIFAVSSILLMVMAGRAAAPLLGFGG
jgi:hypothetical protein